MLDFKFKLPTTQYIFKGFYFFFTHPKELWLKTLMPIVLTLIFSVFSIGVSIRFLLPRQVEKLIEWHWPHWMSWFVSAVSTVLEAAVLNLIFFAILVPIFQDAVFDATLKAAGLQRIFDEEEERDLPYLVLCWRNFRSSVLVFWFLLLVKIILLILTAPLQIVPIAGNILACYINGWPTAWSHRLHYDIELRGFKVSESYKHAVNNKWKYANFGAVAFFLEILPIFNIFFTWTNIVGTALWVADEYKLEKGLVQTRKNDKDEIYPAAQAPSTSEEGAPLLGDTSNTNNYSA